MTIQALTNATHAEILAALNTAANFAPLSGSDKQITWADKIRKGIVYGILPAQMTPGTEDSKFNLTNSNDNYTVLVKKAGSVEKADAIIAKLANANNSKFWIDNRNCTASQFIEMVNQ